MRAVVPGGFAPWLLAAMLVTLAEPSPASIPSLAPIGSASAADAPPAGPAQEPQPPGPPSAPAADPAAPPASADPTADLNPTAGPPLMGQADYTWVWVLLLIAFLLVLWLIVRGSNARKTRSDTHDGH